MSEQDYIRGQKAAYRSLLSECVRELDGGLKTEAKRIAERADVVAALRRLCVRFGDNDWDDGDHLGDVIEKHLEKHLNESRRRR